MDAYQVLLILISIVALFLQCHVLLMVQYKSPDCMKGYRYYLNAVILWDMLFSFFFSIILQPYPISTNVIIGIRGVIYYFGYEGARIVVSLTKFLFQNIYCRFQICLLFYFGANLVCAQTYCLQYRLFKLWS